jgi:chromosomal replication initiation ATPase DnaA
MNARSPQLPLDFKPLPAFDRAAFLVTESNAEAVAWIDKWPDWPAPALVLHGPPGSGKTHLASVWRARANAGLVAGAALDAAAAPELAARHAALVIEPASAAAETALLHLYNMMAERRGHLLLVAATPPARWPTRLPDLRSRLNALPVAEIAAPDDRLIRAVLIKLFADRQVAVSPDIIDFLALRMERSFEVADRLVAAIDATALAGHRRVTVPLVRSVLEGLVTPPAEP